MAATVVRREESCVPRRFSVASPTNPPLRDDGLLGAVLAGDAAYDEVFLVSDEHGVVPAADASGDRSERFRQGYAKLLASMDAKARRPL